ncbi:MAG: AAA family ATPase [Hyperionvirus sp.]|uniref:AAA family ATPase n=1 Tax=Hyperionvirus sp. TaxID=2487770 RepID=A0A3G5AB64_9VIRU|nr:MAG: AAA family ATPase [Hyperionvirus sp.]
MSRSDEFVYAVKFPHGSAFLYELERCFPGERIFDPLRDGKTFYAHPGNGPLEIATIKCYATNDDNITLSFRSVKDWNKLQHLINEKKQTSKNQIKFQIHRYSAEDNYWYLDNTYKFKSMSELIGYDSYVDNIERDISNFSLHSEFLNSIGENKSLNYLLYGPPGTGKTTLIRTLASKHNFAIFIVNPNGLDYSHLADVLNPRMDVVGPKLLLFEDFDRFLEDGSKEIVMSQILNSLDGLDDSSNILRFFTGNNCDVIFKNKALINRMSAKFKFDYPSLAMFRAKLMRFLTYRKDAVNDQDKIEKFLNLVETKKITMRPFVNYCIRYLFEENYIDEMVKHHEELDD